MADDGMADLGKLKGSMPPGPGKTLMEVLREFEAAETARKIPLPPTGRIVYPREPTGHTLFDHVCPHGRHFTTARRMRMACPKDCRHRGPHP